jgi:CHASE3 domain sensor protein
MYSIFSCLCSGFLKLLFVLIFFFFWVAMIYWNIAESDIKHQKTINQSFSFGSYTIVCPSAIDGFVVSSHI